MGRAVEGEGEAGSIQPEKCRASERSNKDRTLNDSIGGQQ